MKEINQEDCGCYVSDLTWRIFPCEKHFKENYRSKKHLNDFNDAQLKRKKEMNILGTKIQKLVDAAYEVGL